MSYANRPIFCVALLSLLPLPLLAAQPTASITLSEPNVDMGQPVFATLMLVNATDKPVTLASAAVGEPAAPLAMDLAWLVRHVAVITPAGPVKAISPEPSKTTRDLVLAPGTAIGARIDLAAHFADLKTSQGTFEIRFHPPEALPGVATLNVVSTLTAVMQTSHGVIRIELDSRLAPATVANFAELARNGFYDGLTFHRIVKGFMIQGGCPQGTGIGSRPDGKRLKHEGRIGVTRHLRGTISMARGPHPDSASCQFFICHADTPSLDPRPGRGSEGYTAFGRIVGDESFKTLDKIAAVPVEAGASGENSKPTELVRIVKVTIE